MSNLIYLIPIALFMIMGEAMFRSGIAIELMDTLDKWFGKVRGRLALMAVGGGVLFSTLTGNSMGSIALLGSSLTPEMEKRGYAKSMSLGPILGSSGLAIMIPPSSLAVVLGVIGDISIGRILIGIIVPGFVMALLYVLYILGRCHLQPHLAPTFDIPKVSLGEKLLATGINIVPLSLIVFSVVGVIFLGIATPTEAAGVGGMGALVMAVLRRELSLVRLQEIMRSTLRISSMVFLILIGASIFSLVFRGYGGDDGVRSILDALPGGVVGAVMLVMLVMFLLGFVLDFIEITFVVVPIVVPFK